MHQPPLTIEEQIENLQKLNLIIPNVDYAKKFLKDVSYFRLIKAYSLGLKSKDGTYKSNITFEQIVELYLFNANLRQNLFSFIEIIEVNLRTILSNYVSVKYDVLGYLDSENFSNKKIHEVFMAKINDEIKRNKRSPFIKNFQENYDGNIPFYALTEIMSFGALSKFYKNLHNNDKKEIAQIYQLNYTFLESWIESIAYVRNLCAHYGRLYNVILAKKPRLFSEYREQEVRNDRLFAVLCCIKHLIPNDHQWEEFVQTLDDLFSKYSHVNKFTMGFPSNWKKLLVN